MFAQAPAASESMFGQRASVGSGSRKSATYPEVFAAFDLVQHPSGVEPVPMITLLDSEPAELLAQVGVSAAGSSRVRTSSASC